MRNILLPLLLGGLVYAGIRRKQALDAITYDVQPPYGFSLSKGYIRAILPIVFDNPSPQNASFDTLYLQALENGKSIGNVVVPTKAIIPARKKTIIKANLVLSLQAAGLSLLSSNFVISDVELKGTVKGAGINLYINKTIDVNVSKPATATSSTASTKTAAGKIIDTVRSIFTV